MSKRTREHGSSKRKKAIAKADALRAVIDKTKPITSFLVCQKSLHQRQLRIWNTRVNSCRILCFSFGPGAGVKNLWKTGPGSRVTFHFQEQESVYCWISVASMAAGVWTGVGFENFSEPVSSEISDLCEISDLVMFFSYFASQNKEIKSGNYFSDVVLCKLKHFG